MKLRGQISQGLLLPLPSEEYEVNTDVSETLGIQKYEPPAPAHLAGSAKGSFPHFIPKTEQERVQNIDESKLDTYIYEVTEKLEGSSMTVYVYQGKAGVCSRNIDLKDTDGNSFWETAKKQYLTELLKTFHHLYGRNIVLQGELIGSGIQGNIYKFDEGKRIFYLFDIYDIDKQVYFTQAERFDFLLKANKWGAHLPHAPIVQTTATVSKIKEALAAAEGVSALRIMQQREGLVFKSVDGTFSFKAISNKYLLKAK